MQMHTLTHMMPILAFRRRLHSPSRTWLLALIAALTLWHAAGRVEAQSPPPLVIRVTLGETLRVADGQLLVGRQVIPLPVNRETVIIVDHRPAWQQAQRTVLEPLSQHNLIDAEGLSRAARAQGSSLRFVAPADLPAELPEQASPEALSPSEALGTAVRQPRALPSLPPEFFEATAIDRVMFFYFQSNPAAEQRNLFTGASFLVPLEDSAPVDSAEDSAEFADLEAMQASPVLTPADAAREQRLANAPALEPNCREFQSQAEAQVFFEMLAQASGEDDSLELDSNNSGLACEALP